ncbi:MAG: hypothetical protein WA213_20055 [Terriglobales bacterium]
MADNEGSEGKAVERPDASPPTSAPVSEESDAEQIPGVVLPPLPPTGKAIEFKQQINVYQIPQNAWDRLNQEQTLELTKMILERADAIDKRHFDYAVEKVRSSARGKKTAIITGSLITIAGYAVSATLALYGHDTAAIAVSLPITTILALVVGNRFLG